TARGALLHEMGQLAEAADALEAARALDPGGARAAALLGTVLTALNRLAEAETVLRPAVELAPDDVHVGNNLAAVLIRLQRNAEARDILNGLVDRHGAEPTLLCNLANATLSVGLQDEAHAIARQAIALAPDCVLPWRTLCNTLPYCEDASGESLLAVLRSCSDKLPRGDEPCFANSRDPERRLRIGLLSGSLKTHPVGWLTIAGFEALDSKGFDIIALAQATADDPIARRFRVRAAEWHDISTMDDAALAEHARALGIDILIDLGGYGDAGRMPALARRLAPVQIKWVGSQNHSTGVAEMDWFITDGWETPPELEHLYSERVLRLPDGYACYSPPAHAPPVGPLPALTNGFMTFGCFNNLAKITPLVFATWAEILRRKQNARLVLKTYQFSDKPTCARVLASFAENGVARERIELRGSSPHRVFLDEYNRIDFVLDPFPYSGGLTTCEALWMGVPTLTMPGETFASRHSTSHMSNVGLADWVASDRESYIELALAKASDIEALAALRAGLRAQVKASPLCDAPRFGRNLGHALRHAWRMWTVGQDKP
ncbi:MAG: tetratricopeptide repeat protein, partial [Acetobacteraceae bacterium]|nr:tetratricopeptide repeat protein [Acetobacteraceae bacterium]